MEKNLNQPIFVPDNVRRWFDREIVRVLKDSRLWHPDLCPFYRLFLLNGQPGTQMDGVLYSLIKSYGTNISFDYLKITNDEEKHEKFFETHYVGEVVTPLKDILIIDNVECLLNKQDVLGSKIYHLKRLNYSFIIAISSEFPNNEHLFWKQFKVRIPMRLPSLDHYKLLLQYLFNRWSRHWKYSKVDLSDEDFNNLAMYCCYCTPKDVIHFTKNIFRNVIDSFPDNNINITMSLLEDTNNMFLFTPFYNDENTYCIINEDKSKIQKRFDPQLAMAEELNFNNNGTTTGGGRKRLRTLTNTSTTVQIGSTLITEGTGTSGTGI
jgi:hypothetical protein